MEKYGQKKILVVGLGLLGGGVGVARFFAGLGAQVRVTDRKTAAELAPSIDSLSAYPIKYTLGKHELEDFLWADIIFKGPFVPWNMPELTEAEKKGTPVEMELSFFAANCPAPIIGVTGTRGKSTTTSMIYHILKESGRKVRLAGSIPHLSSINMLPEISKDEHVVMELPSWPLSGFHRKKISPHIAVFTNFYPDHLNYYTSMEDYFYDKSAIFAYQKPGDYLIINKSLKDKIKTTAPQSTIQFFGKDELPDFTLPVPGEHNKENAAAAVLAAQDAGVTKDQAVLALSTFKGLPYRIEVVKDIDGITIVNDTTSTTPIATITALKSFEGRPVILLLGGKDKNLPYKELLDALKPVDSLVLLKGSFTDKMLPELRMEFASKLSEVFDDLKQAYIHALKRAESIKDRKPVILFSPAATSFAMFNNEFHRGEEFNKIVKETN